MKKLDRRASRVLARWEALEGRLRHALDPRQRRELADLIGQAEERLVRLRRRIGEHWFRLRPTAGEVRQALQGMVESVGTVRHRRIGHEVALFERRLGRGRQWISEAEAVAPAWVVQLSADLADLLASKPKKSSSGHRLTPAEKARRKQPEDDWLRRAGETLEAVRRAESFLLPSLAATSWHRPVQEWLADAEDYLEFGADRQGVLRAMRRRRGWRLEHLLR